jgi:hypothetical protein
MEKTVYGIIDMETGEFVESRSGRIIWRKHSGAVASINSFTRSDLFRSKYMPIPKRDYKIAKCLLTVIEVEE